MPDPEVGPAPGERSSGALPQRQVPGREAAIGQPPGERREAGFSAEQRAGLRQRQVVQDRTLRAMHQLESALGSAAPRREGPWRHEVLEALAVLESATTTEAENAERPDSLLADIARTQPRLRNRARAVRLGYRQLREAIVAIRRELGDPGDATEVAGGSEVAGASDLGQASEVAGVGGVPGAPEVPGGSEVTGVAGVPGPPEVPGGSEVAGGSSEPAMADTFDVADVRHRLAWILSGLRQQRARESDLIYEAYFDAFRADLAAEHDRGSGS